MVRPNFSCCLHHTGMSSELLEHTQQNDLVAALRSCGNISVHVYDGYPDSAYGNVYFLHVHEDVCVF